MAYAKIRPRRGTLYEWTSVNPVIAEGELVIVVPDSGVGTGLSKIKIGDGFTKFDDLPYAFDGEAASAIYGGNVFVYNEICIRTGTTEEWESENPILASGEIAYDSEAGVLKVGDGVNPWKELNSISGGGAVSPEEDNDWDFGDMDVMNPSGNPVYYDFTDEDYMSIMYEDED